MLIVPFDLIQHGYFNVPYVMESVSKNRNKRKISSLEFGAKIHSFRESSS